MARFKAKSSSDLTAPLGLSGPLEGWEITVRYVPPAQERDIRLRAASGSNYDARFLELFTEAAVAGWSGCKPEHIGALVELDPTGEALAVDGDGCVPFDIDLAKFLMSEAPAEAFQNPIAVLARTLLRRAALVKKTESFDSAA